MRVNVYVDGFNLYNRAKALAGEHPGWKWLDIRALATALAIEGWPGHDIEVGRVVYCTTLIHADPGNPDGPARQKGFINALRAGGSVDIVEYGLFVPKAKIRPLARRGRNNKPILITSTEPVLVKNAEGDKVPDAFFYVTVADREEKGSDVNVATHFLLDALAHPPAMDAAIVISNDSDLRLPVYEMRKRMPVGVVNPGRGYTAGALEHDPDAHVDGQWERQLTFADFTSHQMADVVGHHEKPDGW